MNSIPTAALDIITEPFYSPYTPTGLILCGVLIAAVVAATVFIILRLAKK